MYENTLVRQTEAELNSQAFFVASTFKSFYLKLQGRDLKSSPQWQAIAASLDLDKDIIGALEPKPIVSHLLSSDLLREAGESLNPILKDAQRFTLSSIQVTDEQGLIISSTNQSQLGLSMLNRPELELALKGQHNSIFRSRTVKYPQHISSHISRTGAYRVHVSMPVIIDEKVVAAIVLSRTPQTLWQVMALNKQSLIVYTLSIILFIWLISVLTALSINRPIAALIEQARRALQGEKAAIQPLSKPITEEVATLSNTFSNLASKLEKRSEYILEFASHVSHEFKTPVTSIQGAIELLIDHQDDMSFQQQTKFLNNIQKDSKRLENLVHRLLEFARSDLQSQEDEKADLLPILTVLSAQFPTVEIELNNKIMTNTSEGLAESQLYLPYSQHALDSIFSNLINNAVQAKAKKVQIELKRDRQRYSFIDISIKDDGEGISQANQDNIFTPFFTTKRKQGGTGLGLAIIRAFLQQKQGDIEYVSSDVGVFKTHFKLCLRMLSK